jgi:hypothetical protein
LKAIALFSCRLYSQLKVAETLQTLRVFLITRAVIPSAYRKKSNGRIETMKPQMRKAVTAVLLSGAMAFSFPAFAQLGGAVGGDLRGSLGGSLGAGGIGPGSIGAGSGAGIGTGGGIGSAIGAGASGNASGSTDVFGSANASSNANADIGVQSNADISSAANSAIQTGAQTAGQAAIGVGAAVDGATNASAGAVGQASTDIDPEPAPRGAIAANALANLHGRSVVGTNGETLGRIYATDEASGTAYIQSVADGEAVALPAASLAENANGTLSAEGMTPAEFRALAAAQQSGAASVN